MNIHFKRFVCLLLVFCLMFTMTGCASTMVDLVVAGFRFVRIIIRTLGFFPIIGAMWVIDQITWPFVEYTGFNVNSLGNRVCQAWTEFMEPEALMENGWWGGWFSLRDEEELEAKLRKGGFLKPGQSVYDQMQEEFFGPDSPYYDGTEQSTEPATEPTESTTEPSTEPATESAPESTGETETHIIENDMVVYGKDTPEWEDYESTSEEYQALNPGEGEIVISFRGGDGAIYVPKAYIAKEGDSVLTKDVPVKPGHHFMGWVLTNPDESQKPEDVDIQGWYTLSEPRYFPGQKVSAVTGQGFEQNTTLYAIWAPHGEERYHKLWKHEITVEQVKSGVRKTHLVTITCSCGMNVVDPNMLEIDFLAYCKAMDSSMSINDANRLYRLYRAQYIGPIALKLNTEYFDENILFDQTEVLFLDINNGKINENPDFSSLYSTGSDLCDMVQKVTPIVEKYAQKKYTSPSDKELVEEIFEEIGEVTDAASETFEKASFAVSLFQVAEAVGGMLDEEKDLVSRTVSMLDTIECISSFAGVDSLVAPVAETLREGLSLVKTCEKTRGQYYSALEAASQEREPTMELRYLKDVFGRNDVAQAYHELTLTGTPGCTCGKSGTCNFDAESMTLRHFPSVFTTIRRIHSSSNSATPQEKAYLMLYLAERSRHELYRLSGLTLEQYAALVG